MLASWNIDFVAYVRCRKLWSTACACSAREVCELQKQINRFFMDKSITTIVSGGASHLAGSRGVPCTQRACCAVLCCTLIAAPGLTSCHTLCICQNRHTLQRPQHAEVAILHVRQTKRRAPSARRKCCNGQQRPRAVQRARLWKK
jgi:hypothetical protein